MWFAIAPVMPNVKKPKCVADGQAYNIENLEWVHESERADVNQERIDSIKAAYPESTMTGLQICDMCSQKYPNDDTKYNKEGELKVGVDDPAKGASDPVCKVCYPYESRVKGRKGCGGLGLTDKQVKDSTVTAISGTIILRILIGPISDGIGIRLAYTILLVLSSVPGFLLAATQSYIPLGELSSDSSIVSCPLFPASTTDPSSRLFFGTRLAHLTALW